MSHPEADPAATLQACRRAARTLTRHLVAHGEKPMHSAQLDLIRALLAADEACARPVDDAHRLARMVSHFFTPIQLDFATELLAEFISGAEDEAQAIVGELEVIARETEGAD